MATDRSVLRFLDGGLQLDTPWGCAAEGKLLLNGHSVDGPWGLDDEGRPTCEHGSWRVRIIEAPAGAFSMELGNITSVPQYLETVHFGRWDPSGFSPTLETCAFRELVFGSVQGINAGVKCVGRRAPFLDFAPPSSMLTVYQRDDGTAMLLGILPPVGDGFSEFSTLHSEPHLEGSFGVEARHAFRCQVGPGESVHTSPLVVLAGAEGTDLMAAYGRRWRDEMGPRTPCKPMVGWSSWDTYSGAVTRDAMDSNLRAGTGLFGDSVQVFSIDEGWEQQWGSWEANAKFGGDLAGFCRHVKSAGRIPGIWTAPLLVNTYNPLFLERPDWFAETADGQLKTEPYAYGPMAYLDVTVPEVLDHLKATFTRLREAGFEYFKVDFSHCILNADRFADPSVGRNGLIRRAFATIREAIGEAAYLLSCGSPYESVVGLVDSVRTTADIHIYWGHVLRNAGSLAVKWWMQGNLWNCDPDFLVVRGPETALPPFGRRRVVGPSGFDGGWMAGREFNEMEARTYALLVHLSGGDVILGDALGQLKPNAVEMVRRVLTPRSSPAVPVDLFTCEHDLPRIWISRGEEDTLVGLFNWSDKPATIAFDPRAYGLSGRATDFWTDAQVADVPERMARRSSVALRYGPATSR